MPRPTLSEFDDKDVADIVCLLHGFGCHIDEMREARQPVVIAVLLG